MPDAAACTSPSASRSSGRLSSEARPRSSSTDGRVEQGQRHLARAQVAEHPLHGPVAGRHRPASRARARPRLPRRRRARRPRAAAACRTEPDEGQHGEGPDHGAAEGAEGGSEGTAHERDRDDRADGAAARDAEHVGLREGIADEHLQPGPGHREQRTHDEGVQDARQAQGLEDPGVELGRGRPRGRSNARPSASPSSDAQHGEAQPRAANPRVARFIRPSPRSADPRRAARPDRRPRRCAG